MSKFVKDLQMKDLRRKLEGVEDLLVVNVIGMNAVETNNFRNEMRKKDIAVSVVSNTLAGKVLEEHGVESPLSVLDGPCALVWGSEDPVSLAKEVTSWNKKLERLQVKGGFVSGQKLDAEGVTRLSKMANREETLAQLVGQILSPGANLVAALLGPGSTIAGQLKTLSEEPEGESETAA